MPWRVVCVDDDPLNFPLAASPPHWPQPDMSLPLLEEAGDNAAARHFAVPSQPEPKEEGAAPPEAEEEAGTSKGKKGQSKTQLCRCQSTGC